MTTVLFTDTFTVSASADINAYPSGSPDWAYSQGTGSNIQVIDTTDRLECSAASNKVARVIDASVPSTMGNQLVRLDAHCVRAVVVPQAQRFATIRRLEAIRECTTLPDRSTRSQSTRIMRERLWLPMETAA